MSTRELRDILASGEIEQLKLLELEVRPEIQTLLARNIQEDTYGHVLAVVAGADANNGAIFFNTENQRVCWKSPGGLVFKFNMQLV